MNIGKASRATGVSAKMIRHYESIGLIESASRSEAGYRIYNFQDLNNLRFIRRARSLGFSLEGIRQLLGLWQDKHRPSSEVKSLALKHAKELDHKIEELTEMRNLLNHLAMSCHGDGRPECPILDSLADGGNQSPS